MEERKRIGFGVMAFLIAAVGACCSSPIAASGTTRIRHSARRGRWLEREALCGTTAPVVALELTRARLARANRRKKSAMTRTVLGIIGGSGVYDIPGLENARWERVTSPWGEPSRRAAVRHASTASISSSCRATAAAMSSRRPRSTTAPISTR